MTISSHSVEISIAGGVEEMVRVPNPKSFSYVFGFYHVHLFRLLGTKTRCSASYGKEKTPIYSPRY